MIKFKEGDYICVTLNNRVGIITHIVKDRDFDHINFRYLDVDSRTTYHVSSQQETLIQKITKSEALARLI